MEIGYLRIGYLQVLSALMWRNTTGLFAATNASHSSADTTTDNPAPSTRHPAPSTQHPASIIQHPAREARTSRLRVWAVASHGHSSRVAVYQNIILAGSQSTQSTLAEFRLVPTVHTHTLRMDCEHSKSFIFRRSRSMRHPTVQPLYLFVRRAAGPTATYMV